MLTISWIRTPDEVPSGVRGCRCHIGEQPGFLLRGRDHAPFDVPQLLSDLIIADATHERVHDDLGDVVMLCRLGGPTNVLQEVKHVRDVRRVDHFGQGPP